MRRFNATVFDDVIHGTNPVYTSQTFNAPLGQFDTLVVQAVVDNVDATGTLDLYLQHSADGKNWSDLVTGALFVVGTVVGQQVTKSAASTAPALALVRILMRCNAPTTRAHVRVFVTARDQAA